MVQAIPPHKNWDSILRLIEIQHSKKHWSLFSSKHIPQHWWLKNRTVLTQFNPKCCLSYGTAQKHPSWLVCTCAGHCKERQADTISCSRGLNLWISWISLKAPLAIWNRRWRQNWGTMTKIHFSTSVLGTAQWFHAITGVEQSTRRGLYSSHWYFRHTEGHFPPTCMLEECTAYLCMPITIFAYASLLYIYKCVYIKME